MKIYVIPKGTPCRRWRPPNNGPGGWEDITTTKTVTYTDDDICEGYLLQQMLLQLAYITFTLPKEALPYTLLDVSKKYIR